ncbi:histone H1-delta-like [Saccostrea cucullata]|uniref:histone H1-delta-like n=1 Tax=Saccostrea cuccullata TaxID=36930 RepID=UPI002ED2DEF1
MADSVAPAKSPAKKKATKPKVPAAHPKYIDMISAAVSALKERGGSSRQAILKYIMANYKVGNDANFVNAHLKMALKNGVKKGALKQAKGTGASGSFKLGEKPKTEKKPKAKKVAKPKAAKLKKTAAKPRTPAGEEKAKTPKKKAAAAAAAKKPAGPKKAKSPKKKATPKSPKKAATKPKKAKTPKKTAAKKTKTPKKASEKK